MQQVSDPRGVVPYQPPNLREVHNGLYEAARTTTPLGASQTYTSPVFRTEGFGRIVGTAFADQAGTLYVDWTWDGVNFDGRNSIAVNASTPTPYSFDVHAPFARIRYTNGATAQTVFRLAAFLRRF